MIAIKLGIQDLCETVERKSLLISNLGRLGDLQSAQYNLNDLKEVFEE
jgi:hypothetical protein